MLETNYGAVFLERILLEELKAETVEFFLCLCLKQLTRIEELQGYFRSAKTELAPSVCFFLDTAISYYKMMGLYAVFRKNAYMFDKVLEKKKNAEQIYFENNFIAHNILDMKDHFEKLVKKAGSNGEQAQYPAFALAFFNDKLERDLKKSISTFDSLKDELKVHAYANTTMESLLNEGARGPEEDPIVARLMVEAGLVAK